MNLKEFLKDNPPNNKYVFGKFIRFSREQQGKSLRMFAKELNVTASYLSDVENGKRYAPLRLMPVFINKFSIAEDEVQDFYDLAYLTRGKGFPDINEYLRKKPIAVKAVRAARNKDLSGEEFLAILDKVLDDEELEK